MDAVLLRGLCVLIVIEHGNRRAHLAGRHRGPGRGVTTQYLVRFHRRSRSLTCNIMAGLPLRDLAAARALRATARRSARPGTGGVGAVTRRDGPGWVV